jgi:hypothetical protein
MLGDVALDGILFLLATDRLSLAAAFGSPLVFSSKQPLFLARCNPPARGFIAMDSWGRFRA